MTPERIEQERKAFEEWYYDSIGDTQLPLDKHENGCYCNPNAEDMFTAWCAPKSRPAQSEWISVEDRLPGMDEFVLVFRNWDGKLSQCVDRLELHHDCEKPEGEQDWYDFLYSNIYEVTHWQPLPEPPETRGK